ncbi:flagellar hook-length control protein FliK [Marinicellulosiphila megalodicopiae]|uniref:flagellar hook-length control protein FliK n=1 Tax=Marinicellulosiphila megalodicopiae TaxID=2724896 RepID=UPI003BAEE07B
MQPMLGVSFVNTQNTSPSQSGTISPVEPANSGTNRDVIVKKNDFTDIFKQQVNPSEVSSSLQKNESELTLSDGEQLPMPLSLIGNNLDKIQTLDELKNEFEQNGLNPVFFEIDINSDKKIDIQPAMDDGMQQTLLTDYSNIFILQLPLNQMGENNLEDMELNISATLLEQINDQLKALQKSNENSFDQINEQTVLTNIQWSKNDGTLNSMNPQIEDGFKLCFNEIDFNQLNKVLNGMKEINEFGIQDGQQISLIVLPNTLQNENLNSLNEEAKKLESNFISEQIYSQASFLAKSIDNESEKLTQSSFVNTSVEILDKSKQTNDSKWLSQLNPIISDGSEISESEVDSNLDTPDLELENIGNKEEGKAKRTILAEQFNQGDKSGSAKNATIELPPINLSDAKQTSQSIKLATTESASLLETVLPQKQAMKLTEEVGSRVMMLHTQKMTSAFIRLDPPELGALEIKVETNGDEAKVTIVTSQINVKEALDSQANKLREMLQEQGFTQVDVDVKEQNQSQQDDTEESKISGNGLSEDELEDQESAQVQEKSVHLVDQFV